MVIGIDARLWNQTGVGRYIRNLVAELENIDKKNDYVLFVRSEDKKEINLTNPRWKIIVVDIPWHSLKEQLEFPKILNKQNLDMVHFPYFSIPIFYKKPYVVTVHDLIMHHFSTGNASTLPKTLYKIKNIGYKKVVKDAINNSKKIIVPSNFVKEDVAKLFNVSKSKIVVTYEGIDEKLKTQNLKPKIADYGKYFLYIGNAYPHKNLESLIEGFENFCKKNADAKLLLVGKEDYFYKNLKLKFGKNSNIIFLNQVSDAELSNLYKNAIALVSASLMEGFGLPVLEAMSQKCLVVCSDIPTFKEITNDNALLFNLRNISELSDALQKAFDKKYDTKILEIAYNRSLEFSWKKAAQQTLDVYESSFSL